MLASLRRIYFYSITAGALLFTTAVLQNFIHQLSVKAGIRDYVFAFSNPQAFSQSVAFLLVALVIVAPVGVLHWWLIRRDAREDPVALRGVVREIFLDLLTLSIGTTVITSGAALGYALFYAPSGTNLYAPSIASPLASFLAWGLALAALIFERRVTAPDQLPAARGISLVLGYLQQLGLLITFVIVGAQAIQNLLDTTISVLPRCDFNSSFEFQTPCQFTPFTPLGSAVAMFVVIGLGLAGFTLWTRRDTSGSVFRQLVNVVFLITGTITTIVGVFFGANLVLHLATGQPGVMWPDAIIDSIGNGGHYQFVGPLMMGAGVLAFYLVRAWRMSVQPQQSRQVALVAMALPLAVVFLAALIALLTATFDTVRGRPDDTDLWLGAWSGVISGAAWVGLWPTLARMSNPRGMGPTVPRRVYEIILLGGSLLGTTISLAIALYYLVTSAINATADFSGSAETAAFATALVLGATAAYYYFVFQRDQRILRQHVQPASASSASEEATSSATPTTLESVLQQVAAGQLSVPQAAEVLRAQFGAH